MTNAPTLDGIFAVMAAASYGDTAARITLADDADIEDASTRIGLALNVLLDDLAARAKGMESMADRLRIIADAAHEFSAVLHDPDKLLETVARRVAGVVKDQCVISLTSDDGLRLLPVAIRGVNENSERQAREMFGDVVVLAEHPISRHVHETGEPFIAIKLDPEMIRGKTTTKYTEDVARFGVHSVLIVPLRVQGRSIGHILLARHRPESPSFDEHDLKLTSALADHAAIAISNAQAYAAAEKAKNEARELEARYRLMFDKSPLPKWLHDAETLQFLAVNDAAIRDYGYSREEFLTMTIKDIRPPEDVPALLEAEKQPDSSSFGVWRHRKKNGQLMQVELIKHTFMLGARRCRLAVAKDVTERLRLEEQLRQSQKMDAVGRLAGGIAHDFNNVLSVILSYSALVLSEIKPGEPMRDDIEEIRTAGRRAADLTRQLLMFSRQQVLEPKVLDLNDVLANMDKMLQRILGADIDLFSVPAPSLGRVRVDPGNIEQVIMNLVVNARDAMPTGGQLTMETGNVVLDEAFVHAHLGVNPGPHVMLAVTDTGTGMDKATQARIFEPFFTTKEQGKGTGLGLSTVFGIVQQSGGSVWVYSEIGRGTTFKINLPRVDADVDAVRTPPTGTPQLGTETILLVEDDDQVRAVARGILRKAGYHVIEARHAGEALLISEKHGQPIELLLSDVVMPQMSGPELAKRLAQTRPEMKVLCMSGYTDDSIVRHGVLAAKIAYLQKPFTPDALTARVREVLDGVSNGRSNDRGSP